MTHIDEIFKKGLENHEVYPSENVWKNVLEAKVSANKRRQHFAPWAIAASLILLMSAGIYAWKMHIGNAIGGQSEVVNVEQVTNTGSQATNGQGIQPANQAVGTLPADTTQVSPPTKQESTPEENRNTPNKSTRKLRHPQQWQKSEMRYVNHEPAPAAMEVAQLGERSETGGISLLTYEIQPLHTKPFVLNRPDVEQLRLVNEVVSEKTPVGWRGRIFRSAKDRLTDWAENAGIPVTELASVTEIEILY